MHELRILCLAGFMTSALGFAAGPQVADAPLPDVRELVRQAHEHQKQLEKVRENYTYTAKLTTQDIDSNGQVKKTETMEAEQFFANGHQIGRMVTKDGKPLDAAAEQKETERVTKLVEKAEKTPPDQELQGPTITVGQILEMMDVRNERRQMFRGRSTIVFDFVGRKDAKTHGMAQDVSKKLQGTLWIDEADKEIAHCEVSFTDNFSVGGGLVARIEKGSKFTFDQAQVNGEIWLPTGAEGTVAARLLLVKGIRQHFQERDTDFKRFHVEAQQNKDAKALVEGNK
jgi:hypothetical protein